MIHHSKAPTIQRLALVARQTYTSHPETTDIDFVASMGTHGKDERSRARELMENLQEQEASFTNTLCHNIAWYG
jgi:hypothetical protein